MNFALVPSTTSLRNVQRASATHSFKVSARSHRHRQTPGRRILSKTEAGKAVTGILIVRSYQNATVEKQLQKVKRRQFFPCFYRRSFNSLSEMLLLPDWSILDSKTSISTSLSSFSTLPSANHTLWDNTTY
jgi:hypothetical protein